MFCKHQLARVPPLRPRPRLRHPTTTNTIKIIAKTRTAIMSPTTVVVVAIIITIIVPLCLQRPPLPQWQQLATQCSSSSKRWCRRVSFAQSVATTPPVSTMACAPARAARASSSAPCRRTPSTCVWLRRIARWTSVAGTAVSTVDFRSVWRWAWSRRWCGPLT